MTPDDTLRLLLDRRAVLLGYIASILPDRAAGEDVFQEALILAHAQAARFEHPGHLLAWVRGTARHLALNEARSARRRAQPLDARVLDLLDADWAALDGRDDLDRLEHCLDQLAPTARTMVRLRFTEGLDGAAIAQRIGKTLDAVHAQFGRIFAALRLCLDTPRTEGPA